MTRRKEAEIGFVRQVIWTVPTTYFEKGEGNFVNQAAKLIDYTKPYMIKGLTKINKKFKKW